MSNEESANADNGVPNANSDAPNADTGAPACASVNDPTDNSTEQVEGAAGESQQAATDSATKNNAGAKTVSPLVWVLVAIIVVMALIIGVLIGTRLSDNSDETATTTSASAEASGTESTASAQAGLPEDQGSGATLWGPGVKAKDLKEASQVHRRQADDPFAIGKKDAPVVISEFADFECPFCSRHANTVEPKLMEYVNAGKVRLEWNDFPVNGPFAQDSAKAGRAAAEQGKFYEYKHALYEASKDINGHPEFTIDDFVGFAKKAGVKDIEKFRKDATSDKYDEAIDNATQYASGIGITGTPAFIVGETFISGAQPEEAFVKAIEDELAKTT